MSSVITAQNPSPLAAAEHSPGVLTPEGVPAEFEPYRRERIRNWDAVGRSLGRNRVWLGGYYHRRLEQLYRYAIPENVSVLELGCGAGRNTRYFAAGQLARMGKEALVDHEVKVGGEHAAHAGLLDGRERVDDAIDRLRGAGSVDLADDQIALLDSREREPHHLDVAHVADDNDVGVFAEGRA